jgi:hypothetical protein
VTRRRVASFEEPVTILKLYRSASFTGDRDRVEHLFGLYEKLVTPLEKTNISSQECPVFLAVLLKVRMKKK